MEYRVSSQNFVDFIDPVTGTTVLTAADPSFAAPVSPSQAAEVSFISGIDNSGNTVATAFATWASDAPDNSTAPSGPATYNNTSAAQKWGASSVSGTSGGTINYYFNPSSNWTPTEQSVFTTSTAIWSAEANVTFNLVTAAGLANLTISRGTDKGAFASNSGASNVAIGTNTLGQTTSGIISIDTSVAGFGPVTSVTAGDGYPASTVSHEIGHVLSLGHDGPYNGNVNSATNQYSNYDTRLWSIESYIAPTDTAAKYYSSSPVTGTNWGTVQVPETPMALDILAMQQLYGAPTSTPLSGNQVFGFNTNIGGALANYFNFNLNTTPVLTLYDKGTGNTLDLSGYSTNSAVNLNAGTFSSANGMTNNIGIAYSTAINSAIGGAGDDTFTVNAAADTINGGAGNNTTTFSGNRAAYALSNTNGVVTVTNTANNVVDTLTNIQTLSFADMSIADSSIACYLRGTRVATPDGEVAVETLAIGDLITTASGAVRPVRWIGRRAYAGQFVAHKRHVQPIRFQAGSLGSGLPYRDLYVSPEHAMFLDGVLVPAKLLVNGDTISQCDAIARIEYVHIELDTHDVILAEGAASETFIDDGGRGMFHNAADYRALYPERVCPSARYCAPRVEDGEALEAIIARLRPSIGQHEAMPLQGFLDIVRPEGICGWARCPAGTGPLDLTVWDNGALLGVAVADCYRDDLVQAGIGDGCHGFEFAIAGGLVPGLRHVVEVRDQHGRHVGNSPWVYRAQREIDQAA